jgi:hypothetical protein
MTLRAVFLGPYTEVRSLANVVDGCYVPPRFLAGAYTRQLFSSTGAVSDTEYTVYNSQHPPTPPKHPKNNP